MVTTTLRAYLDELKLLMEQEALEEVMGHCRHILQHFPRNLETYRFLGRALLEKHRYDEAGDVFQRVLSALPDDFVSHLGLSNVAEEQGQLPAAVWHMESAHEQDPSNAALQDELKRLYEKRDGAPPDRIQLTRAALARMYVKGKLYQQAVNELQSILAQSPDRMDMQLLLAQVYWDTERPAESAEVALKVLETLPYSLDANRILSSLWLKSGRPSDAEPFVARLEQLDPFLAWDVIQPETPLPKNAFQLPRLDWDARAAAAITSDVPDWVSSIGDVFQAPESVSLSGGVTNWRDESTPTPTGTGPLGTGPLTTSREPGKSGLLRATGALNLNKPASGLPPVEIPDWAKDFATPAAASTPAPAQEEVPDWFKDAGTPATPDATAMPDWFNEPPASSTPALAAPSAGGVEVPSWLEDDLGGTQEEAAGNEQLPSGFTDLLATSSASRTTPSTPSIDADEMPSWLADEEPSGSPAPSAAPLDAMSWLQTGALSAPEQPAPAPSEEPLDAMSWLQTGPLSAPTESAPAVHEEPDFDWMNDSSSTPAEPAVQDMSEMSDLSLDWLGGTEPQAEAPVEPAQPAEGGLDWLGAMPSLETPAEPAAQDMSEMSDLSLDWLGGTEPQAEAPVEPAQPAEGGLDWLGAMPSLETPAEPAAQDMSEMSDLSLDWLGGTEPQAEVPVEPAQPAESGLDWLGAMPSLETPAEPAAPGMSDMPDLGLDWLSSEEPQAEVPVEPAQPAEGGLDWLGAMPSLETPAEPAAQEPELFELHGMNTADNSLDWLGGTPSAEAEPAQPAEGSLDWLASPSQPADSSDLFELNQKNSDGLDWLGESASAAQPADGLDWMNQSEQSSGVLDNDVMSAFAQQDQGTESGEAMSWLSDIAPASAQPAPLATPLEELDFSQAASESNELDWMSADTPSEQPASEDWLTSLESTSERRDAPEVEPTNGWLSSTEPAQSESVELEDDWLASFETPLQPVHSDEQPPASAPASDWGVAFDVEQSVPEAASTSDWLDSLETDQPEPLASTPAAETNDWLGALETAQSEESTPEPSSDSWLSQPEAVEEAGEVPEAPEWMRELQSEAKPAEPQEDWLATTGAKDHFDSLLKTAAEKAKEPRVVGDTGVLDPGNLPDWMDAFTSDTGDASTGDMGTAPDWLSQTPEGGTQAPVTEALQDLDFSSVEPVSGETPEWLSSMAPGTSTASTDETEEAPGEETPDWLAAMAPGTSVKPVGELDFGSLESAELSSAEAPDWLAATTPEAEPAGEQQAVSSGGFSFEGQLHVKKSEPSEDRVAQPANLVNTNIHSQESGAAFNFDRQPAWMRKKKSSGDSAPNQKNEDDLPDWLKQST